MHSTAQFALKAFIMPNLAFFCLRLRLLSDALENKDSCVSVIFYLSQSQLKRMLLHSVYSLILNCFSNVVGLQMFMGLCRDSCKKMQDALKRLDFSAPLAVGSAPE